MDGLWKSKEYLALAWLILFAAWSRFSTLEWDLQHGADGYEGHFLRAVRQILDTGDLNHNYPEYPGLFLYLLLGSFLVAFVLAVGARLGTSLDTIHPTYFLKMDRGLVAVSSVLNVPLTFRLGQVCHNSRVGLLSAAVVCFSFLEIHTSQFIRPDIVLETFIIIALTQIVRVVDEGTIKATALAGIAVGVATAVKYTGFLVYVPLLVASLIASGTMERRIARVLVGFSTLILAYAVLSPYSFLDIPGFLYGVAEQGLYNTDPSLRPSENMASYYTGVLAELTVGYSFLICIFAGLTRILSAPRRQNLVLVSYAAVYLMFFFVAPVQFDRFLLSCLPVLAVFGAYGFDTMIGYVGPRISKRAWIAFSVGLATILIVPLVPTLTYLDARKMPSVRDETRNWVRQNLPPGSRIAVSRLGPSLEGTSFVSSRFVRFDESNIPALRNSDFLASAAIDAPETLERFTELARFQPRGAALGNEQEILQVPEALRPKYRRTTLATEQLRASYHQPEIGRVLDGNLETVWRGEQRELRQQIEIEFDKPVSLGTIVMTVPEEDIEAATTLRIQGSVEGRHYRPLQRFLLSETISADSKWIKLTLFLDTSPVAFLRLRERRASVSPLAIAELKIHEKMTGAGSFRAPR